MHKRIHTTSGKTRKSDSKTVREARFERLECYWPAHHSKGEMDERDAVQMIRCWAVSLAEIPQHLRTQSVVLEAVKSTPLNWRYVDKPQNDMKVRDALEVALKKYPTILGLLNPDDVDEAMCITAVTHCGKEALKHIPLNKRTMRVCLAAVKKDGMALQYVPIFLRDEEMCFAAVGQNGEAISEVPKQLLSYKMCKYACENALHLDYRGVVVHDEMLLTFSLERRKSGKVG